MSHSWGKQNLQNYSLHYTVFQVIPVTLCQLDTQGHRIVVGRVWVGFRSLHEVADQSVDLGRIEDIFRNHAFGAFLFLHSLPLRSLRRGSLCTRFYSIHHTQTALTNGTRSENVWGSVRPAWEYALTETFQTEQVLTSGEDDSWGGRTRRSCVRSRGSGFGLFSSFGSRG